MKESHSTVPKQEKSPSGLVLFSTIIGLPLCSLFIYQNPASSFSTASILCMWHAECT